MKKIAYYPEDENVCHYIYMDGEGNAAYEQYSIDKEMLTDHLNNLSDEEKEEWLCNAYEVEEEMAGSEEEFVDQFINFFDVHDDEEHQAEGSFDQHTEEAAEVASKAIFDAFVKEGGEMFSYDNADGFSYEFEGNKYSVVVEKSNDQAESRSVGVKGPVH